MVLLAVCDARFGFNFVDVGEYGRDKDSRILKNSAMGKKFMESRMSILDPEKIGHTDIEVSYFLIGDEIFRLQN